MKTDVQTQMNAERPDVVLSELEAKRGSLERIVVLRLLERMRSRRDWSNGWLALAVKEGRSVEAHGWHCRAVGLSDAIEMLEAILTEAQHNGKVSDER